MHTYIHTIYIILLKESIYVNNFVKCSLSEQFNNDKQWLFQKI